MASISFPQSQGPHSASSSFHDESYYSTNGFEDTSATFQMNPLSAHPPRTPRASLITAHSHIHGTSMYDTEDDLKERSEFAAELKYESVSNATSMAQRNITPKEDVWREIILTSNGRDKVFKLFQYSIKLYLYCHFRASASTYLRKYSRPSWEGELVKRLQSAMGHLSFSRKTLLLFNWITPLTTIMAQQTIPYTSELSLRSSVKPSKKPLVQALLYASPPVLLDLINCVSDDIYTLSRMGIIDKRTGDRAGRFSDWCWMIATLVGLIENQIERGIIGNLRREVENRAYVESLAGSTAKSEPRTTKLDETELTRLNRKDFWLGVSRTKLLMDLIFVSYDVFKFKRAAEPVKAVTGLTAAILSTAKLFDRHRTLLTKATQS